MSLALQSSKSGKIVMIYSKPSLIDRNECHLCLDHAVFFVLLLLGIRREEGSENSSGWTKQGESRAEQEA